MDRNGPAAGKRSLLGRLPKPRPNSTAGSRRHIQHHYDLGNDFYRLWLDEEMVYTCAYYDTAGRHAGAGAVREVRPRLPQADAPARPAGHRSRLRMGQPSRCTWRASTASRSAPSTSLRSRSPTRASVRRATAWTGWWSSCRDDYRNIEGACDAFVSVGMLEHVGVRNYEALGGVIARTLKPEGLALIHSVGRNRPTPVNAWLEQRIFPGSHPPSLREMMAIFEPYNFTLIDVENLRLHYARTLDEWLARFDRAVDTVRDDVRRGVRAGMGACISRAARPRSTPTPSSSSRWSARRPPTTACPGPAPTSTRRRPRPVPRQRQPAPPAVAYPSAERGHARVDPPAVVGTGSGAGSDSASADG